MAVECRVCDEKYDAADPRTPSPMEPYSLTNSAQVELWSTKIQSFTKNSPRLFLLKRDLFDGNYAEKDFLFPRDMLVYDSTSSTKLVELHRLATTHEHKTIVRTMPDRNANINDICWALKNADQHQIGMNVFFLHRWSFVLMSILPPPSEEDRDLSRQHTFLLIAGLQKKYTLIKKSFEAINKEMAGVARVESFAYKGRRLKMFGSPQQFYKENSACASCHEKARESNSNDPLFNGKISKGDLAGLMELKEESFSANLPKVGFISGVSQDERIQHKITQNSHVVIDGSNTDGVHRRFFGNINLFASSDKLLDNHDVETTVFRTMPDRNARIKDLTWALEASNKHRIGMNVYLLHKRNFFWIHVQEPKRNAGDRQLRRDAARTQLLVRKINDYYTLRKNNIHKLNAVLYPVAKIAYFKYPNLSWKQSITEDTENEIFLMLKVVAAMTMGLYTWHRGVWSPYTTYKTAEYALRHVPIKAGVKAAAKWGVGKPIEYSYRGVKFVSAPVARAGARYILSDDNQQTEQQPPPDDGYKSLNFDATGKPILPTCPPACENNPPVSGVDCHNCVSPPLHAPTSAPSVAPGANLPLN